MNGWKLHWCVLALLTLVPQFAVADDYADARGRLFAAYQAEDYSAMIAAAQEALRARPGYPAAEFNLALAHALAGDPESALSGLNTLLRKRIDFGADELDEFAPLRELGGWAAYAEGLRKLREPQGSAELAYRLDDGLFVPEGVAIGSDGEFYVGSIRKGQLLRDGRVLSDRQGHWSVFGMRFHSDGSLWFASTAVAQLEDVGEDIGKTGLFRIDTSTGDITSAALLPQFALEQGLGDLVIDDNTIFTTDSLTGAVYRYDIERETFAELVPRGTLNSPQGLAFDDGGDHLYIADYTGGLYRVRLADGKLEKVLTPADISDHGIDGLYRYGDRLIAIQNGIALIP